MSLHGIQMAGNALIAHQRALELTGQNIANAATPGYSRQSVLLRPADAAGGAVTLTGGPQSLGGGVDASVVLRNHAAWLDQAGDALRGQAGDASTASRLAGQVEAILGEPGDHGLQAVLDRFFAAFQGIADRPDDATLRLVAVQSGVEVARRFEEIHAGIETLQRDATGAIREGVTLVNAMAHQIADLNRAVGTAQSVGEPVGGLQDERDRLLADLSRQIGATVSRQEGGMLLVSVGGITLVQGDRAETLTLRADGSITLADSTPVPVARGEIGARQRWLAEGLPQRLEQIAAIRDTLAGEVNRLHQSGTDRTGAPGLPFFVADPDGDLAVNPALVDNPRALAAGDGRAGDGSVARQIAGLREMPELLPAYRALVMEIGTGAADAARRDDTIQASLGQIEQMQASEGGVNLDEELAQMVAQQHVYAASARLLTAYDQMLETLIQRTGV